MIRSTPLLLDALVRAARAYARASRLPLRTVSRLAYGDSRFFVNLTHRGGVSSSAYDKAMTWFENPKNWPGDVIPQDALHDPFANEAAP